MTPAINHAAEVLERTRTGPWARPFNTELELPDDPVDYVDHIRRRYGISAAGLAELMGNTQASIFRYRHRVTPTAASHMLATIAALDMAETLLPEHVPATN